MTLFINFFILYLYKMCFPLGFVEQQGKLQNCEVWPEAISIANSFEEAKLKCSNRFGCQQFSWNEDTKKIFLCESSLEEFLSESTWRSGILPPGK